MRNHSYKNNFDLHENGTVCRTHFHMKGFALRLVLTQRHKRTRKWPNGFQYLYIVLNIVRTDGVIHTISTTRPRHRYQNAAKLFRCWLEEVRKTGKCVLSSNNISTCSSNIFNIYPEFCMFTYLCETTGPS